MKFVVPEIILQQQAALDELVQKDNKPYISAEEVAKFLGSDPGCLRESIYKGTCPFGVGYPGNKYGNGYTKIPKLTFYRWMTLGMRSEM